jgi:hypothetical protein
MAVAVSASARSHAKARLILVAEGRCVWRCGRMARPGHRLCSRCNALHRARSAAARAATRKEVSLVKKGGGKKSGKKSGKHMGY